MRTSGWTLREQLVALILLLLTVATLVIGTVTVLALQRSLLSQIDDQLVRASARTRTNAVANDNAYDRNRPTGARPRRGDGPGFLNAPGTSEGTLGATLRGGSVWTAATLGSDGRRAQVPIAAQQTLTGIPVDDQPGSYELPGLGAYRIAAHRAPSGDVLVTGLPLEAVHSTEHRLILKVLAVGSTWLLVAVGAGNFLVRRTLRPLRDVAAVATAVSGLRLDRGEVALAVRAPDADPRTEVGQVARAVNVMLGHVEQALEARHASEERVRGFVADASHELRTPLASIRGYAELTRRSRNQVPPDVARALERVESEAGRMTVLVEELLLLARLDAGRQVEHVPVDLTQLVVEGVQDARVAATDHHWRMELPRVPVVVPGDDGQLHQVLGNLLANARTHTPPGSTVTVSLTASPTSSTVMLSVTDDGPGVPEALQGKVFERFVRGEKSRSRTHGSTGLGLSIVASIAQAHGGSASVLSAPGHTTFTLTLPADTSHASTSHA